MVRVSINLIMLTKILLQKSPIELANDKSVRERSIKHEQDTDGELSDGDVRFHLQINTAIVISPFLPSSSLSCFHSIFRMLKSRKQDFKRQWNANRKSSPGNIIWGYNFKFAMTCASKDFCYLLFNNRKG
jgi:hypothetical protein